MVERSFDDKLFERVLTGAFDANKRDYAPYIGGNTIASGMSDLMHSPVDDTIIFGFMQDPELGTVDKAVDAAVSKMSGWSSKSGSERAKVLETVADDLETKRYLAAALVLLSTGMCRKEAVAEVDRTIDILRKAAEGAKTLEGKPSGVWAVIALRSSPLASPIGYAAMALAAGNAVVVMPSGHCPRPVYLLYDMFDRAGLPPGAFNLVADRLDRRASDLSGNEELCGIVASGTGKAIEDLMFSFVDDDVVFVNEVKGMNPIFVNRPGDMDKVAEDILESAFAYAGQHLYSTSKVVVSVQDENALIAALIEKAKDMKVGDPADSDTFCGPLMDDEAEERFKAFLQRHADNVIFGGKKVVNEMTERGRYYVPAIMAGIPHEDDDALIDPSAPVLIIRSVASVEEAIQEAEETECGLSIGVMSTDQSFIGAIRKVAGDSKVFVNRSSLTLQPVSQAKVEDFFARGNRKPARDTRLAYLFADADSSAASFRERGSRPANSPGGHLAGLNCLMVRVPESPMILPMDSASSFSRIPGTATVVYATSGSMSDIMSRVLRSTSKSAPGSALRNLSSSSVGTNTSTLSTIMAPAMSSSSSGHVP